MKEATSSTASRLERLHRALQVALDEADRGDTSKIDDIDAFVDDMAARMDMEETGGKETGGKTAEPCP